MGFQEDIYPQCPSTKPALTADEWISGSNAEPCTMNMDPDERKDEDGGDVKFTKKRTYDEVVAENMELKQLVKKLQDEIAQLKGSTETAADVAEVQDVDEEAGAADEVEEAPADEVESHGGDEVAMDEDGGDEDGGDE